MPYNYKPVVLVVLDGWGVAPPSDGNAINQARLHNYNYFLKNYPTTTLSASGAEVGLLFGEIGNSEVGHLNIGAGRVYYQSCQRINQEISSQSFFESPALVGAIEHAKANNSDLHIVGMLGTGNVHASNAHLYALLELCAKKKFTKKVFVHAILDGRDCIFNSAQEFVKEAEGKMAEYKVGKIATLSGRFYAMDRDNRWDRCQKAYNAMVKGEAERKYSSANQAIKDSYAQKNYDEEFIPTVITKGDVPLATIKSGDAVIFFNFRPDRARQLTKAFVLPSFNKFEREYLRNLYFVTMMEYEKDLPVVVAYYPVVVKNCLAEVISQNNLRQFHVGETEKYAHVTLFLNGTIEEPFPGEERSLVPSPQVASYATVPEMSAAANAKEAVKAIDSGEYEFIVINFANADMVGHTGDVAATIKACEAIDKELKGIVEHTLARGGAVVITADHGNAEEVINLQTGAIDKEHSTNPVPLIIISKEFLGVAGPGGDAPEGDLSLLPPVGVLADVAPTVLTLMGLPLPPEMTGQALI